jgi:hypothetical protein
MPRKFDQMVQGSMGGVTGRSDRKNADGWTKIKMLTFILQLCKPS